MLFVYTGSLGHGKTANAIDHLFKYRDQGRPCYVCNVKKFDYEKTGCLPMTPEQFRDWMNFLPDGSAALIDEAYEHEMLPKRPPGAKVPLHVQEIAKHRHRGIDFIIVCQSPARQIDDFVHDFIEWHTHCRKFYGLPIFRLKKFSYMERNPVKATATTTVWRLLPKRVKGVYVSTVEDTSEASVPWYFWGLGIGLPAVCFFAWRQFHSVEDSFKSKGASAVVATAKANGTEHGASATGEGTVADKPSAPTRESDYWAWLQPRIVGQPWTAPAYDRLSVPAQAPRIFCAATEAGEDAQGNQAERSCTCVTEQGTRYALEEKHCRMLAREGQYEPFRDEVIGDRRRLDEGTQRRELAERAANDAGSASAAAGGVHAGSIIDGAAAIEEQPQATL